MKQLTILSILSLMFMNFFFKKNPSHEIVTAHQTIPLKKFFPVISGNLGDYNVELPEGYSIYDLEDFGADGFFWGEQKDIRKISASTEELRLNEAAHPVLRVRFTSNIACSNGKLVDNNGQLSSETLKRQGAKDVQLTAGLFNGISAVPAMAFKAKMNDASVYMLYLYSPVDNLVVLINMQGGTNDKERTAVWDSFVSSLKIK